MQIGNVVGIVDLQLDGPARITARTQGFCELRFLASGAVMTQEERRLVPYLLLPGTPVATDDAPAPRQVCAPPRRGPDGRYRYQVRDDDGAEDEIDEAAITALPLIEDPIEQLALVAFHDVRQRWGRGAAPLPSDPWGPQTACAREDLLAYRDRCWAGTGGVIALAGARIQPLPHQLLAARRILADRCVRFLLADEVGLGKTIEAGLVMQSLLALRPSMRVLIIAPGALVSQWFLECFVKFGGRRFTMVDGDRLARGDDGLWAEPFVIVSSRAIEELRGAARIRFAATRWDLVVVDECHRMQVGGALYRQVATLSRRAPHLLLLSATPGREHVDAYLALLALLQPHAYTCDDRAGFLRKLEAHEAVVQLLERSAEAEDAAWGALRQEWQALLGDDPAVVTLLADCDEAGGRDRLLSFVREHYRLDHRVISNSRQVLANLAATTGIGGLTLAERSGELLSYRMDAAEQAVREALDAYRAHLIAIHAEDGPIPPRLAHWLLQLELAAWCHPRLLRRLLAMRMAVLEDPEAAADYRRRRPADEDLTAVLRTDFSEAEMATHIAISAACHADDPEEEDLLEQLDTLVASWERRVPARLRRLAERIRSFWEDHPQEKVLVFVGQGLAVAPVAGALADLLHREIETFGAHQDALGRETAARRFRDTDTVAVMVSDPLGGEGRNFQFVSVVAHLDLPWSIAAVEQRIGRVDRLGRDGLVPSWICHAASDQACDRAWAAILDRAVGVFSGSASGLEFVAGTIEERSLEACLRHGAAGLDALLPELGDLVTGERTACDHRQERLFRQQEADYRRAGELATTVARLRVPIRSACHWLRGMGGHIRRDEDGARAFHLRARNSDDAIEGVFDREIALRRDDLAFFAQGHDLIDRLIADAERAGWCRATAWRRAPSAAVRRWEGLRLGLELRLDLGPVIAAGLPLEILRRVITHLPAERPLLCYRFGPDGAVREEDPAVCELVAAPFDANREDRCLSPRTSREFWLRPLCSEKADQVITWQEQVRSAGAAARQAAAQRWSDEAGERRARLAEALDADRAILAGLAASAAARLGADHPDSQRLAEDRDESDRQSAALLACLDGATYDIAHAAYVVIA